MLVPSKSRAAQGWTAHFYSTTAIMVPRASQVPWHQTYLLHVSQNILPSVKDAFSLFRIQVVYEVCGVVFIAFLISGTAEIKTFKVLVKDLP